MPPAKRPSNFLKQIKRPAKPIKTNITRKPLSVVETNRLNLLSKQMKLIQNAFHNNKVPENKRTFFINKLKEIIAERNQLINQMYPEIKPNEQLSQNLNKSKELIEKSKLEKEQLKRNRAFRDKIVIENDIKRMQKIIKENNIPKDIIKYLEKYVELYKNEKYVIFNSKVNYLFNLLIYKLKLHTLPLEIRTETIKLIENNRINEAFNYVKKPLSKIVVKMEKTPDKKSQRILKKYKIDPNSIAYNRLQYFNPKELTERLSWLNRMGFSTSKIKDNLHLFIENIDKLKMLWNIGENKNMDMRRFFSIIIPRFNKNIINENMFNSFIKLTTRALEKNVNINYVFNHAMHTLKKIITPENIERIGNSLIELGVKAKEKKQNLFYIFSEAIPNLEKIMINEKLFDSVIKIAIKAIDKDIKVEQMLSKGIPSLKKIITLENIERIGNSLIEIGTKAKENEINPHYLFLHTIPALNAIITEKNISIVGNNLIKLGIKAKENNVYVDFLYANAIHPLEKVIANENIDKITNKLFELFSKVQNYQILENVLSKQHSLSKATLENINWYDFITLNIQSQNIRNWANNLLKNENISRNRQNVFKISQIIELQEYINKYNLEELVINSGKRRYKEMITAIELAKELNLEISSNNLNKYLELLEKKLIIKGRELQINITPKNYDTIKPYLANILYYVVRHKRYPNNKIFIETLNAYLKGNWKEFRYTDLLKELKITFGENGKRIVEEWQRDFVGNVKTIKTTKSLENLVSEINNILDYNLFIHIEQNSKIKGILELNPEVIKWFENGNNNPHIQDIINSINNLKSFSKLNFKDMNSLKKFVMDNVNILQNAITSLKINAEKIFSDLKSLNVFETTNSRAEKIIDSDNFLDLFYAGKVDNQTPCQAFDYKSTNLSHGLTGYIELPWVRILGIKSSETSYSARYIVKLGFISNKLAIILEPFYGDSRYKEQLLNLINQKAKRMGLEVHEIQKRDAFDIDYPKAGRSYAVYSDIYGGILNLKE